MSRKIEPWRPSPRSESGARARGRSVYLTDELWAGAEARSRRDGRSVAYVISAALRAYLAK